ncbi:hypothetical protein LTS17_008877 [Exophiala oligosperma]
MDETAINASSVRSLKDETKNNSAAETPLNKEDLIVVGSINSVEDADDVVLRANGHDPAMQRQFKWLSALGLAFSITNSWVGYLSNFGQNLIYNGPRMVIFGLVLAFFVQFAVTLGLSELASAFPSSGGQYHFCYILAPKKHKRFAAFIIGWMSVVAWWVVTSSGLSLAAVSICGLARFFHPDFVIHAYQIWLVYVGCAFITIVPLFLAPSKVSVTVQVTLFLSLIGMVLMFIIVLAMRQQVQPASWITQGGLGTSGWNDGTAWLLGITNAMYTFGGTDGAIHISEEMSQPGRRVPQVMGATMLVGILTALPIMLALMFCMNDLDAVINSPLPSLEIVYQATGSKAATSFTIIWLAVIYVICLTAQWVTAGRIAWAFARDHGVPFSNYFARIDPYFKFPVRTTVAAFVFVCCYGLLYLASTTAFNSIVTGAVLYLNITYAVPQGIALFQGRKKLPPRYLNLGWLGYFCNAFSCLWIVILGVMVCFPPSIPTSTATMNYTSVILVGLFTIFIIFWFTIGRNFEGPHIQWDMIQVANQISRAKNPTASSSRRASVEA